MKNLFNSYSMCLQLTGLTPLSFRMMDVISAAALEVPAALTNAGMKTNLPRVTAKPLEWLRAIAIGCGQHLSSSAAPFAYAANHSSICSAQLPRQLAIDDRKKVISPDCTNCRKF